MREAKSAVVVGAGFIGLEFAAAARKWDVDLTVLEAASRPMARAVSPFMSGYVADVHRSWGIALHLEEGLHAIEGDHGTVTAVVGASGRTYRADLVVTGVGARARDELAQQAGLLTNNGVVVDHALRTSDPFVYAVGDCANAPGKRPGSRIRLESVQNATDQARRVAHSILGTDPGRPEVPWFWSTQGDLKLQIAGLGEPGDVHHVSGDPATGRFSVLCFRDEHLVAVESMNRPADHIAARRVLAGGTPLCLSDATDPSFNLKAHAQQLVAASRDGRPT
jgi:3-phenylpropionate/trans-cinnamate dioxygenase ferredoxin reductase subunit